MIGLIQRVTSGSVTVNGEIRASINEGLVVLVGFQKADHPQLLPKFIERITGFRLFSDQQGKMNLSVADRGAEVLWVPQFTLAADTHSGRRPSFSTAAHPQDAKALFDVLMANVRTAYPKSSFGCFGEHMQVTLTNNGPVTFWIEVS